MKWISVEHEVLLSNTKCFQEKDTISLYKLFTRKMIQDFYSEKIYLYSTTHFKNKEYLDVIMASFLVISYQSKPRVWLVNQR